MCIIFVWDFPTLSQEQQYFFLYLFVYESQVFVTWSLLEERGPWECLCVAALYTHLGCCQLVNHFDLFSRFDQFTR